MSSIVEMRELSNEKLEEMLENSREEMFNLRFQKASARLENTARIKEVRRQVARAETVLRMRELAVETAASHEAIASALGDKVWNGTAVFDYEESAYLVEFFDSNDSKIASATVDMNKKKPSGRKARLSQSTPAMVLDYEVEG